MGFGWNYYGFPLFTLLWVAGYFAWVFYVNRRSDRHKEQSPDPESKDR